MVEVKCDKCGQKIEDKVFTISTRCQTVDEFLGKNTISYSSCANYNTQRYINDGSCLCEKCTTTLRDEGYIK